MLKGLHHNAKPMVDPELVGEVLAVIRELADEGMTMILVTHEMLGARDQRSRAVRRPGLHPGQRTAERGAGATTA